MKLQVSLKTLTKCIRLSADRRSRIQSRRSTRYYPDGKEPVEKLEVQSSDLLSRSSSNESTNQNRKNRLSSTRIENFGREKTQILSKQSDEAIRASESSSRC